jgi:Ca2+-binding EF-hand superfamily protein
MNVVIAIVVDSQAQAREEDSNLQYIIKQEQTQRAAKELLSLFHKMDLDGGGTLTLDEVEESYDNIWEFRHMLEILDVTKNNLPTIFGIIDSDDSGVIEYSEFVQELHNLKSLNARTLGFLTREHVRKGFDDMDDKLNGLFSNLQEIGLDGSIVGREEGCAGCKHQVVKSIGSGGGASLQDFARRRSRLSLKQQHGEFAQRHHVCICFLHGCSASQ